MKKIRLSILVISCIAIKAKPQKTLQEKLGYSKDAKELFVVPNAGHLDMIKRNAMMEGRKFRLQSFFTV